MVSCKPKKSTYLSLGIIVLLLFMGLSYLLYDFNHSREFPFLFYLIGCSIITVVLLLILVKMMAGYKFLAAGNEKIEIWLPLKGQRKKYKLEDLLAWQEEEVLANKKVFKQLILVFSDKYSFAISNHEHLGYDDLRRYLGKKASKKRVKN
ncbi:hypothetical protein [Cyclobacterium amurskyense]|uniref:Uncharacterized protein n=1 Tax=Cyclobacterium amurskyense TaxID=320787 RepID=A0A0H4PUX8_9BACT|nr:hypothetical protein [Cyclobacterium amurskyense]AKP52172.1 hypothetical protein CA2015_2762 [Cyclobacterium amurskyense]|tara:strand:+ start:21013 stop:21462 length:450 start_codon:yes stop_codon:yes gene_type:complete